MLGSQSAFQRQVRKLAPEANSSHCSIHRYALVKKTLPAQLTDRLNLVKIVDFIQAVGLSSRQFQQVCKDMN